MRELDIINWFTSIYMQWGEAASCLCFRPFLWIIMYHKIGLNFLYENWLTNMKLICFQIKNISSIKCLYNVTNTHILSFPYKLILFLLAASIYTYLVPCSAKKDQITFFLSVHFCCAWSQLKVIFSANWEL